MRENPVRSGAYWVVRRSRFVSVDHAAVEALAEELGRQPDPKWVERYHFQGEPELTLRYLLVLDALNFCFWPPRGFPAQAACEKWGVSGPNGEKLTGYYALSFALRRVAEEEPEFFAAERLARLQPGELSAVLGDLPLLSWRVRAAREVGALLLRFGSAERFFSCAEGRAQRLVELVTAHLPMFRDAAVYEGKWIPFHKRAQILAADVWGSFRGQGPGRFEDMAWLTAFADYKLPQILWARGALRLHPALAGRIRKGEVIPWGSPAEVELRAATVVAVEELAELLRAGGRDLWPFQVDWLLWNAAQGVLSVPHHRTLTWAY
ncbi:MAG: queuosine 5'-phosphate N-glycosylase/hydrolase [Candidatus Bipolaricaulaceae bacterium]